jgi:hypothetical protein
MHETLHVDPSIMPGVDQYRCSGCGKGLRIDRFALPHPHNQATIAELIGEAFGERWKLQFLQENTLHQGKEEEASVKPLFEVDDRYSWEWPGKYEE